MTMFPKKALPPEPEMKSRLKEFIARTLLIVLGLFLALPLGEVLIRSLAPQHRAFSAALHGIFVSDPKLGYVMKPNFRHTIRTPEFVCDMQTNSLGLRDREPEPLQPGDFRLLVLGDSFTFGVHAGARENCFVEQLEAKLETALNESPVRSNHGEAWHHADVVNAGVAGYGTTQEVGLLHKLGPALRPHAVLLAFYIMNDFSDNSGRTRMTLVDGYQMLEASAAGYREAFRPPHRRLRLYLHAHSELYLFLKRRLLHPLPRSGAEVTTGTGTSKQFDYYVYDSGFAMTLRRETSPELEAGRRETLQALQQLRTWCDEHHAQALVVAIPAEQQVDPTIRARWIERFHLEHESFNFDLPQQRLAALCSEVGVELFDMRSGFAAHIASGESLYIEDDDHWNVAGHALAADLLLEPTLDILRRGTGTANGSSP